jgi:hypothetical protein
MSFEAAAWAIKAETGNSTQKLVLIIISDCISGETGIGWPSVDYIAKHCMCSPASVRRAIKELVSQGLLTVEEKKGRSNIYRVNEYPLQIDTPLQNATPISNDRGGCHSIAAKPQKQKAEVLNQSLTNKYIEDDLWNEFLAIRKKVKAVNSPRALKTLLNKIEKFQQQGHDVNALVETAIINSWKDIYLPRMEKNYGNRQPNNQQTATELATNMEW